MHDNSYKLYNWTLSKNTLWLAVAQGFTRDTCPRWLQWSPFTEVRIKRSKPVFNSTLNLTPTGETCFDNYLNGSDV